MDWLCGIMSYETDGVGEGTEFCFGSEVENGEPVGGD